MDSSSSLLKPLPSNSAQALASSFPVRVVFLLLIHIPIGLLDHLSTQLATFHALLLPVLGFFFLLRDSRPRRLVLVAGYMTGAETLWRLRTTLNFEYDKYAIGLLLIAALVKYGQDRRINWLPFLYLILLIPGIYFMPFFDREAVAFNLAGPALLALAACFFSIVEVSWSDLRNFFIALLAPIVSVAAIAAFTTITTENIVFSGATNPYTSGGDGGNQISAILGLGALTALLLFTLFRQHTFLRLLMVAAAIDLLAQSAFTFARGGFYTAVGAIIFFTFYSLRNRSQRLVMLFGLPLILAGLYLIFPILNSFSGGVFLTRLQNTDTTGRDLIALEDLTLFSENLLHGVGVGESVYYHADVFRITQPHTEETRMLAEHGLLGLLALIILLGLAGWRFLRPTRSQPYKAIMLVLVAWSLATTLHIAMRLAAPCILFGFGALASLAQPQTADYEMDD